VNVNKPKPPSIHDRTPVVLGELKNGRLAMIGMASIIAATAIPGSVPLLANAPLIAGPAFVLPFGTF